MNFFLYLGMTMTSRKYQKNNILDMKTDFIKKIAPTFQKINHDIPPLIAWLDSFSPLLVTAYLHFKFHLL